MNTAVKTFAIICLPFASTHHFAAPAYAVAMTRGNAC